MKQILIILLIMTTIQVKARTDGAGHKIEIIDKIEYYPVLCNGMYHRPAYMVVDRYIPPARQTEPGRYVFTREDLAKLPYTNLADIISLVPGVYQRQRGNDVQISGGRTDGTMYVLDNMQVMR